MLNKAIVTFCKLLQTFAIRLTAAAPTIKKGIFVVKSYHGYTIEIDEVTLDFDCSYNQAQVIRSILEQTRNG